MAAPFSEGTKTAPGKKPEIRSRLSLLGIAGKDKKDGMRRSFKLSKVLSFKQKAVIVKNKRVAGQAGGKVAERLVKR